MENRSLRPSFSKPLAERGTILELQKLRALLEPKKPKTWHEKLYNRVVTLAKYVGIPGVIIAAIGPTQKLASDLIEHQNKTLIKQVYLDHSSKLIAEGSIDRANKLLTTLENQKDFDARLQYYKAKVLIAMAIQQARNYTEAFDTASVLTQIAAQRTPFFPSIGATADLIELNLALVDIDTAQQKYKDARDKLKNISQDHEFRKSAILEPNVEYRLGSLDVLEYKTEDAKRHLQKARELSLAAGQKLVTANATFQLAKAFQFGGDHSTALSFYKEAEANYISLPDKFGLLRTYNNMAMIYFDDAKNDEARAYYNREQTIAREVGDDLGYARATVNIAVIEKNEKNYNASVRLGLEALGVFKQQGNSLGITTAANVLANAYVALNNYPDAVAYARQNLDASLQLRELRGVSSACGTLSNIYADKGDNAEMAFSSLCAATLIKQLKINNLPHSGEDYGIFVSRLRRLVTGDRNYPATIAAAEKRVQDIFISLNLGTELIRNEVAALQASTIPLDRSAPSLAGK